MAKFVTQTSGFKAWFLQPKIFILYLTVFFQKSMWTVTPVLCTWMGLWQELGSDSWHLTVSNRERRYAHIHPHTETQNTHTQTQMCSHTCRNTHTPSHTHTTQTDTLTFSHLLLTRIYSSAHTHTHAQKYTHTHRNTHTHTHRNTHTHSDTHTHTHSRPRMIRIHLSWRFGTGVALF